MWLAFWKIKGVYNDIEIIEGGMTQETQTSTWALLHTKKKKEHFEQLQSSLLLVFNFLVIVCLNCTDIKQAA